MFLLIATAVAFSPAVLATECGSIPRTEPEFRRLEAPPLPGVDAAVERAKLAYFLGRYTADADLRAEMFSRALQEIEVWRSSHPKHPGVLLWWAGLQGEASLARGKLAALGKIGAIESALLELAAADPAYDHHGADRALGSLYHEAPTLISIGSYSRARDRFAAAMAAAPAYPANRLYYAKFLSENGERGKAVELAESVLASLSSGEFPVEACLWRRMATEIVGRP